MYTTPYLIGNGGFIARHLYPTHYNGALNGSGGGFDPYGEFDNDIAAFAGGVPYLSYYILSETNTYGLPRGIVKKQVEVDEDP